MAQRTPSEGLIYVTRNTVRILSFHFCNLTSDFCNRRSSCLFVFAVLLAVFALAGCEAERRKSDAELGLNPQQAAGRKLYDNYCDRCHEPYSSRGKKGPSLKGVFKQQYLPLSGLPANDARVGEIIKYGRSKMEGFGQVMTDQQVQDLLAYLHTL
jgi:mono/diheme cytochrome c family protein